MDIQKPATIQQTAASRLGKAAYDPRRLVLIHTGVSLGLSVLLTILDFLVNQQIGNTGGLSGIGTRSILTTMQTLLMTAGSILLPFWQFGFLAAALAMARGETFTPAILTRGFRRFRSVLGLLLLQILVSVGVAMASIYVCSMVFVMTPLSNGFLEILEPMLQDSTVLAGGALQLDDATLEAVNRALLPISLVAVALFVLVLIPIRYRFRVAEFMLMDEPQQRGSRAFFAGMRLMRGRTMDMLRLDLHFWWYYLLQALTLAVGAFDIILSAVGVPLPINENVAYFLFFFLQTAGQLGLYLWARPTVETSYALFYDALQSGTQPVQSKPRKQPWEY